MKRPILALLILALLASVSFAQPLVLSQRPADGTYVLTVAGSTVTLQKAAMLQIGPVVPVDPDDPVDPVDDRAQQMSDLINALPVSDARHQNSIKFAGTLRFLAEQMRTGLIQQATFRQIYGPIMAAGVPDGNWAHIKQAALDGLATCPSPEVCRQALEQYAEGAMRTVPSKADPNVMRGSDDDEIMAAAEEYGFDWSAILKLLLPLLLALLQNWISMIPALLLVA